MSRMPGTEFRTAALITPDCTTGPSTPKSDVTPD
jgi:hypothetical protein